jgi:luciferase family oxidoreductase group 1
MKTLADTPLSVLGLATYPQGKTISDAFQATLDLARHAERCGYRRIWLAEHHNLEGVASAATPVLICYVAAHTETIRVGSGGVMLPNHAPLIVAEQFGTLETLFPGRIDLGLGRAPGADGLTMRALRRDFNVRGTDFPELIAELLHYFAPAEPGQRVKAIPGAGLNIPIWILGSSLYSAELAAALGRPYAFAGHFAPAAMLEAFRIYRSEFRPSEVLQKPYVMAGVPVVAAETDERAEYLATSLYRRFLSMVRGNLVATPPPVESMEGLWSPHEEAAARSMLRIMVVGGREKVREGLQDLLGQTGADELMIVSELFDYTDSLKSFEIVAEVSRKKIIEDKQAAASHTT